MIDAELKELAEKCARSGEPVWRTVATNLTDLHKGPSFLDELLTQVLNGTELEILQEKDRWCFVRQRDGYLGWAYAPYLTEAKPVKATHIITGAAAMNSEEAVVTRLFAGTQVELISVDADRATVRASGEKLPSGWVSKVFVRPLDSLPFAPDAARKQMIADAAKLTGVYYLWGGNSPFGTDCSGLTQLVHRLSGYTIPRDADMQFAAGKPIQEPFQPGDLLFFHSDKDVNRITHVGLSTGGWNMIHSSRNHNGVYEDDVQKTEHLRKSFAGARTFLK
jgi:cell wall-associated NlpC family hydrolase